MLELREVFEMTTKQMEPDVDSWGEQKERQRKANRNKKVAALAVAAAIGLVAVALILGALGGQNAVTPANEPTTPRPSASPTPAGVVPTEKLVPSGDLLPTRYSRTVEGVPFSFSVPTYGWEPFGSLLVSKSSVGPQDAEAVIFWTGFPDGTYADPCGLLSGPPAGSAADLAAAVATAPGTELVTGPSDVVVGGRAAKHVVLTVRKDVGCDPGFFYNWKAQTGGAMWVGTGLGDTIWVWIVDVDGKLLFIEGETNKNAGPELEHEIQQIVESIRFD
jgi:hypothetical protein